MVAFSMNMRKLRLERGLSQKQAAAWLGISQALLSHYEKGIRECGLDFVARASRVYGVSADYLLGLDIAQLPASITEYLSAQKMLLGKFAQTGSEELADYLNLSLYIISRAYLAATHSHLMSLTPGDGTTEYYERLWTRLIALSMQAERGNTSTSADYAFDESDIEIISSLTAKAAAILK